MEDHTPPPDLPRFRFKREGDSILFDFPDADTAEDVFGTEALPSAFASFEDIAGEFVDAGIEGDLKLLIGPYEERLPDAGRGIIGVLVGIVEGTRENADAFTTLAAAPAAQGLLSNLEIQAIGDGTTRPLLLFHDFAQGDGGAFDPFLEMAGYRIDWGDGQPLSLWDDTDIVHFADPEQDPTGSRAQAETVALFFDGALGRQGAVATPGLNHWTNALAEGLGERALAKAFFNAPEFAEKFGTPDELSDRALVEILFRNMLGRDGQEAGIRHWSSRLEDQDFDRLDLLLAFVKSGENRATSPVIESLAEPVPGYWTLADIRDGTSSTFAESLPDDFYQFDMSPY